MALRRCRVTLRLVHVVRRPAHRRPRALVPLPAHARIGSLLESRRSHSASPTLTTLRWHATWRRRRRPSGQPSAVGAVGDSVPQVHADRIGEKVRLRRRHESFIAINRSPRAREACDPSGRRGCLRAHPVLSSAALRSETQRMKRAFSRDFALIAQYVACCGVSSTSNGVFS